MEKINLNEYLASNEYPGRGIAVAMAPDGRQMFIGYFIMGRSENSRISAPPLGELARQRLRGRTSLRRQLARPLRHGLRRATSPKGRGKNNALQAFSRSLRCTP